MKALLRFAVVKFGVTLLVLPWIFFFCSRQDQSDRLKISSNQRFFAKGNEEPFFWLGDTGWLLFSKLDREEAAQYLNDRNKKGFNVIQVMVLHELSAVNVYGDSALIHKDVARPNVTDSNSVEDNTAYDYWDHVDFIVDEAAANNLYVAMVPVWGSNVKAGHVSQEQATTYSNFLGERYKKKPNVIWLNGGDIKGTDGMAVWETIGSTLRVIDRDHLISFHPRGRTQSSEWFHDKLWLDFNMFQSGHRSYDQDTSKTEHRYGEDNWKYMTVDYDKSPVKPSLDGEPSYEDIPHGLHDTTEVRWTDRDVRRYAYWSVFAGGCGYTYGHNSVMQMLKPSDKKSAYGAKTFWYDAINAPGSGQMIYLKNLMLSYPYFERIPDQSLVAEQGERYDYIAATRGNAYAFLYTYTGRDFKVNMEKINANNVKATWYDPRSGRRTEGGVYKNEGIMNFDPPGSPAPGNDWVLILEEQ